MPETRPQVSYLISPDGEVVGVHSNDAQAALSQGYVQASPEQAKDAALQAKYGGTGQQIVTGIEGTAEALSGGLSTVGERAIGIPAEDIASREQANPVAHGIGTAVGIAAPLLATAGAAAVPEGLAAGAELTAPSLIAKAGQTVSGAVGAALPEATGFVGKLATKAATMGAGSAVEGAFYGAGHVVHEAALGDPNLTAQSALSEIGLSAALGGGIGILGGAAEVGIPAAVNKASEAIGSLAAKARDGFVEAYPGMVSKLTGGEVGAEKVSELLARRAELVAHDPAAAAKLGENLGAAVSDQYKAVEDALKVANREIRPAERETLAATISPQAARKEYIGLMDRFQGAIEDMKATPELYPPMYAKKLEGFRSAMWRDYSKEIGPEEIFEQLNDLKKNLDPLSKFGHNIPPEHADAINVVKGLRGAIKDSLESEGVWGEAGARQAAFNSAQTEYLSARKDLQKVFMRKVTTKSGGFDFVMDPAKAEAFVGKLATARGELPAQALDRFTEASKKLVDEIGASHAAAPTADFDREAARSLIDKTGQTVADARQAASLQKLVADTGAGAPGLSGTVGDLGALGMGAAAAHVIPGVGPVAAAAYGATKAVQALKNVPKAVAVLAKLERMGQAVSGKIDGLASTLVRGGVKAANVGRGEISAGLAKSFSHSAEDALSLHGKRVAELGKLNDPAQLEEALTKQGSGIQEHAPMTSQAMAVASTRAVGFLQSKMPTTEKPGPLGPELKPSPAEVAKFNRYYNAVQDPTSVLKQAAAGTLTPEAIEAVETVYPELYAKMQQAVTEKLSLHPGKAPYRSKLMLSMLMKQDMDGTLKSLHVNQMAIAAAPKPADLRNPQPSATGAKSLSMSSRLLTAGQASSQRR